MNRSILLATALAALLLSGCKSNNLLLGEVHDQVGTHPVTVTDCYRFRVDPPQKTESGFEYVPCRDARIEIRQEHLIVNGVAYGPLQFADEITVDHGKVLVNGKSATPLAASSE